MTTYRFEQTVRYILIEYQTCPDDNDERKISYINIIIITVCYFKVKDMKYLLEQPIYSLYNNQEQIEFFSKKQILDDQGK